MSSTYSAASADSASGLSEPECEPLDSQRLIHSVALCSQSDGHTSTTMETCEALPEYQLTLFAQDSPVRTLALDIPGQKHKGSMALDQDYGGKRTASSKKQSPSTSSAKTSPSFALADWTLCCGRLMRSGMTRNGTVYRLPPLALLTKETGVGLLPTPRASEWKGCGPKGSKSHAHWLSHFYLSAIVTDSGKLNPTFAERMMGFPDGWTGLSASEIPSSRKSPKSSGTQS